MPELTKLREAWLNPPEWVRTEVLEFPGSTDGPWKRYIDPDTVTPTTASGGRQSLDGGGSADAHPPQPPGHPSTCPSGRGQTREASGDLRPPLAGGIGTVKYPRLVPKDDDCAKRLKQRTLTNLYNDRPTWLDLAHRKLDEAVFAAYGWDPDLSDDDLLAALLALNLQRAADE